MRSLIFTFLLLACIHGCTSEKPSQGFKIQGSVNLDSGTVILFPIAKAELYPEELRNLETKITAGKFEFSGHVPSPMAFYLVIEDVYVSDAVIVSKGEQYIGIDIERNREMPETESQFVTESTIYNEYFKEVNQHKQNFYHLSDSLDSLGELSNEQELMLDKIYAQNTKLNDSTLLSYVKQYPNSFYGFWKFSYLTNFGYQTIFDDIFNAFDPDVKNSYPGQRMDELLSNLRKLSVDNPMPSIKAVDSENNHLPEDYFREYRYTLVDFWYSTCGPCIAQFPDLKKLYGKYQDKGFNIIGVSTDGTNYIRQWENTVKKYSLPWPQYLDENGIQAEQLGIVAYPSSFLVDSEGIIILVNVKPVALAEFLKNNL